MRGAGRTDALAHLASHLIATSRTPLMESATEPPNRGQTYGDRRLRRFAVVAGWWSSVAKRESGIAALNVSMSLTAVVWPKAARESDVPQEVVS